MGLANSRQSFWLRRTIAHRLDSLIPAVISAFEELLPK